MFQLSLQLEIPYVHIYLIGTLQNTYAHGYSRAFGKIGSTCILPAVARKCFLFWGSSETHMIQCTLYSGSETTYISRVHVRILCTIIADQLKSNLGCEKKICKFFMICYEYSGNVVKIRFLPVRVLAKDLQLLIPDLSCQCTNNIGCIHILWCHVTKT